MPPMVDAELYLPQCFLCNLDIWGEPSATIMNSCSHMFHQTCIEDWIVQQLYQNLFSTQRNNTRFIINCPIPTCSLEFMNCNDQSNLEINYNQIIEHTEKSFSILNNTMDHIQCSIMKAIWNEEKICSNKMKFSELPNSSSNSKVDDMVLNEFNKNIEMLSKESREQLFCFENINNLHQISFELYMQCLISIHSM